MWFSAQVCTECWHEHEPTRAPTRVVDAPEVPCVNCGRLTRSGIYVRAFDNDNDDD